MFVSKCENEGGYTSNKCINESSMMRIEASAANGTPPSFLKVTVNGVNIQAKVGRGFQVVVIDQYNLSVKDTQVFDTHGDSQAGNKLRSFVESVNEGDYVMFGVSDEGSGHFQPDSLAAIGVRRVELKYRAPFAGIGRKGGRAVYSVGVIHGTSTEVAEMFVNKCENGGAYIFDDCQKENENININDFLNLLQKEDKTALINDIVNVTIIKPNKTIVLTPETEFQNEMLTIEDKINIEFNNPQRGKPNLIVKFLNRKKIKYFNNIDNLLVINNPEDKESDRNKIIKFPNIEDLIEIFVLSVNYASKFLIDNVENFRKLRNI